MMGQDRGFQDDSGGACKREGCVGLQLLTQSLSHQIQTVATLQDRSDQLSKQVTELQRELLVRVNTLESRLEGIKYALGGLNAVLLIAIGAWQLFLKR